MLRVQQITHVDSVAYGKVGVVPPLFLGYISHPLSHLRNFEEGPPLHNHHLSVPANKLCLPCRAVHRHPTPLRMGSEIAEQGNETSNTNSPVLSAQAFMQPRCAISPGSALGVHNEFHCSGASRIQISTLLEISTPPYII